MGTHDNGACRESCRSAVRIPGCSIPALPASPGRKYGPRQLATTEKLLTNAKKI